MIALLKYGAGMPFNRIEKLQASLGIPLPASTQWEIVGAAAGLLEPAHEELIRQAAQGEVLHNDDTTMKMLELTGESAEPQAEPAPRTTSAPACSPPASWRRATATRSHCSSPAASTRARTSPRC